MARRLPLVFCFAALLALNLSATPDFTAPQYTAIRDNYVKKLAEIDATRAEDIAGVLERQLKEALQNEVKAKVSGNATKKADSSQMVKFLQDAIKSLGETGTFSFPDKIRPANERVISVCQRSLKSADNAAADAKSILLSTSCDEMRKLMEVEGVKVPAELVETYWNSLLAAQKPAEAGAAAATPVAETAKSPDDTGDTAVYALSKEGKNWKYIARVDITVAGMEMFEIPLFPLEQGKTSIRGKGMAGTSWQAFVSAPQNAAAPKGTVAFRVKKIEDKEKIDVMTWPSASNGWVFELRARPTNGTSGNACLIEMGE